MKTISMKKILVVLAIALLVVSISSVCFAQMQIRPNDFRPNANTDVAQNANAISNIVIGVIQVVGVAVAVIMLVVLAIKYVAAAPSEKADIKKSAYIYVVGAILLFGGVWILGMIQGAADTIGNDVDVAMVTYVQK